MARKNRDPGETPELNLVPIMAIMVILVPMLIYMFTFHQIKVQRVTAPRRGTGAKKAKEEQKEKPLNLTVIIRKDKGFMLTWDETLMTEQQSTPLIPMIQSKDEACGDPGDQKSDRTPGCFPRAQGCFCYDFAALYNDLVAKKIKFSTPEKPEKRVNLTADSGVSWEVVSRTMDAVKCRKAQDNYQTLDEWMAADPKLQKEATKVPGMDDPQFLCVELFPQVVFAMTE